MASEAEVWHLVEARRDDGTPAMFRIRELDPRFDQPRIFVVEVPYPPTALSRLPDAASYRRVAQFEEQWVIPACAALGWTFVAAKTEDGSFFLYLYGKDDPLPMIEKLSPFDGALGFFDEEDPNWEEYAALRELLEEANALPPETRQPSPPDEELPPADDSDADSDPQDEDDDGDATPVSNHRAPSRRDAKRTTSIPVGKAAANKPAASKPTATQTRATTSARKKPVGKKPVGKKPVARKPAAKKPAAKKPAAKKTAAKKPAAKKPAAKKPAGKTRPGKR